MRPKEASDYLLVQHGISRTPSTLAKLRVLGGGPLFRKAGRAVIYDSAHLDQYAAEITSRPVRSTSELARTT